MNSVNREYRTKDNRTVTIRLQTLEEVEESLKIIDVVAQEGKYLMEEGVDPERIDWTRKQLESNGEDVLFIVAEINGQLVGNLDLVKYGKTPKTEHVRYLDMAILDGYRSIGVGSALMDFCIGWARNRGFTKVILDVFSSNTLAIDLYKKFGFIVEGTNNGAVRLLGKTADIIQMGLFLNR